MPKFNASQREAIEARNQKILVSAAAGSGKTTVMVEKIRETLIRNPEASVSQFLVITFTRDAARNMKDKLRDLLEQASLSGVEQASRALSEIETASISTIHSFCTQLLKEYNDNTGAAVNPRVLKDAEKTRMMDESFSDAAEQIFSDKVRYTPEDRKAVGFLMTAFRPDEIGKMVRDLYAVLMGIPDPFGSLARIVRELPVARWNAEIAAAVDLDVLGLEECVRREEELLKHPLALPACLDTAREDNDLVTSFLETYGQAETPEEKCSLLRSAVAAFGRSPAARGLDEGTKAWKKEFDDVRNAMKGTKGILAGALKRLEALSDEKNDRLNAVVRQELRGLELLLRETADQYEQRKLEAGAIDYADMEQIAYRIISDPEKREELLARYRYIYVDECQDVSGIQDAIIQSLSGPGHQLFMVGDIKQSIYGFRHAEPERFERKRRDYSDDAEAPERRIFFMDNYRSCKSVVDAVNAVFREAMDRRITDMDYIREDNLRCNVEGDFGPVDVVLVRRGEEDAEKLEAQCEAAGRCILSLVTPAAEAGSREHYRFRDIVILLRTARGTASVVVDHLKKMHIPAMYEGAPDFFGLAEVKSFLALLTVIDNLHNDSALAGALVNTPFLFSAEDLAEIRLQKNEYAPFYEAFEFCAARNTEPVDLRCRQVADQLAAWRKASENMSVPDFVWWLLRETGIYASRGAYPDGKARQANLDALYQRALDGRRAGNMRLSDFIADLREARETRQADSDDPPALGPGDDFVRVMTMHKSKGLEFPVVILLDLQRSIRRKRTDEKLRMDVSSLGLYLPAVRRGKNSVMDSQGREAFDLRALRKNISETTRLLYVAMTRSMQKLCLVGSFREGDEKRWTVPGRAFRIWKTESMLDMVMPAVLQRVALPSPDQSACDSLWRLSCVSGKAIADSAETDDARDTRLEEALSSAEPLRMFLPERAMPVPLKTSVTTLTHRFTVLSEDDTVETLGDKRLSEDSVRTFRLASAPSRPAFLEEEASSAGGAGVGTATHRFIRLLSLEEFRKEGADADRVVRAEMARLKAERVLTEEEASMVRLPGVVSFFRSGLGRRMLESADVRREASFTLRPDPRSPTMVQGIVDCAFREDGEWVLIDYKTDRDADPETFVPRHEMQMNWYREALERLTRVRVKEMWLFALRVGRAYPVERRDVLWRASGS